MTTICVAHLVPRGQVPPASAKGAAVSTPRQPGPDPVPGGPPPSDTPSLPPPSDTHTDPLPSVSLLSDTHSFLHQTHTGLLPPNTHRLPFISLPASSIRLLVPGSHQHGHRVVTEAHRPLCPWRHPAAPSHCLRPAPRPADGPETDLGQQCGHGHCSPGSGVSPHSPAPCGQGDCMAGQSSGWGRTEAVSGLSPRKAVGPSTGSLP